MPPDDEEIADLTLDSAEALKLPNMNEFSPGVLEGVTIRPLLAQLAPLQGDDRDAMIGHLGRAFRRLADTADAGQRDKRSNNVLIGMSQCGLLDKEGDRILPRLSDLANRLLGVPTDADAADAFAAHLIENCHGRDLIDAVRTIRARAEPVQLSTIRAELRSRGFIVTENEGNASKIRQWLQHAGISDEYWNINDARLAATIGATSSTLAKWNGLDRAQRAFLTQLREFTRRGPVDWTEVREIKRLCETGHGRDIFPEGRLRAEVIDPLAVDCWLQTRGTGRGRGGDSGQVLALRQLTDLRISLPLDAVGAIPADLLDRLGTPLPDIFRDLESDDTHVKGMALELLALRIVRDVGLYPDCFRERSSRTGGAEVDLIANGVQLHYSRWLIQCKNTGRVDLAAIAKEVGLATVLHAHVILLVTTGRFAQSVVDFAIRVAKTSALQAILVDRKLLDAYRKRGGAAITDWLRDNAQHVLTLKHEQAHLQE